MKKTVLPLLAALAFPAAAHADPIQCTNDDSGLQQPCTLTTQVQAPAGKVITSYTGTFSDNAQIGLRLMRRNADGTVTSDASTGYSYVAAGRQTVEANLPVPAGDQFIALDLHSGTVDATPGAATIFAADHIFDEGETGSPGDAVSYDLNLSVDAADPPAPTPSPSPAPSGNDTSGSGGSSDGPDDPGVKQFPSGLSFDARSVISPDGRTVEVYARNETHQALGGTVRLKVGNKLFKPTRAGDFDYSSSSDFSLAIDKKARKRILKSGSLKATIVAKLKGKDGPVTKTVPVKVIRGGAKGFDGTYRGKGPLVIVVKNGVITAISQPLNAYCTQNGKFVMRTMQTGAGFPALIGADGSFDHKASASGDSFTYRGKLSPTGESKGYDSVWYSTFDNDPETGFIRPISCLGASNWTVTKG